MADECIHGFDDGLCASCFPPPEPVVKTAAVRTTRAAGSSTSRAKSRPAPRSRASASASARAGLQGPPIDAKGLRIYHVTHIDNLARILGADAVLADQGDPAAEPAIDLSAPDARESRRQAMIVDDASISEYVPFTLTTDAPFWNAVRSGLPDLRLDPTVAERAAADFVILVTSVGGAVGPLIETPGQLVVTDQDATAEEVRAVSDWSEAERLLRSLARDDDPRRDTAEVLVKGGVPLDRFALIAVANDKVRDRVRTALTAVGSRTRVAVYPPWYRPTEAADELV